MSKYFIGLDFVDATRSGTRSLIPVSSLVLSVHRGHVDSEPPSTVSVQMSLYLWQSV